MPLQNSSNATAQVNPFQFTTAVARLAEEHGAKIIIGSVDTIDYENDDVQPSAQPSGEAGRVAVSESAPRVKSVRSVTYTDKATFQSRTIPATVVVLAAGPWTPVLFLFAPVSA
ncbi:hypothetical protein BDZ45DRAFT_753201 [Acephala macrosclerotiorum]|nr:hypothetical protein BDZ45DRAFT_753201 [Acephala macrosclerotiorum]